MLVLLVLLVDLGIARHCSESLASHL